MIYIYIIIIIILLIILIFYIIISYFNIIEEFNTIHDKRKYGFIFTCQQEMQNEGGGDPAWIITHQTPVDDSEVIPEVNPVLIGVEYILTKVYSCGWNNKGQLGLDSESANSNQDTPEEIITLNINIINEISCGTYHSLFLTDNGSVYGCGYNAQGQLGLGSGYYSHDKHITPEKITYFSIADITITKISAGKHFSLFLQDNGRVYSCGDNEYGQLGLNNTLNQREPRLITSLSSTKITEISCGGAHSLFLDEYGNVYSCGRNNSGQLGLGSKRTEIIPKLIDTYNDAAGDPITDIIITKISAGDQHSLFLDKDGNVYSCGLNHKGQLGYVDTGTKYIPRLIETYNDATGDPITDIIITKISAGDHHNLFLDEDDKVYSCGSNSALDNQGWSITAGQLGLGNDSTDGEYTPKLIDSFTDILHGDPIIDIKISEISAGTEHSLFLDVHDKVYSCGYYRRGYHGLGHDDIDTILYINKPLLIENLSGKSIKQISAGSYHSLFLEGKYEE